MIHPLTTIEQLRCLLHTTPQPLAIIARLVLGSEGETRAVMMDMIGGNVPVMEALLGYVPTFRPFEMGDMVAVMTSERCPKGELFHVDVPQNPGGPVVWKVVMLTTIEEDGEVVTNVQGRDSEDPPTWMEYTYWQVPWNVRGIHYEL